MTKLINIAALLFFLPFLLYATYQTMVLIGRAAGIQANISVDTSNQLGPVNTAFYHAFAQGGEEKTDMLAPVINQVKALKPKLIRIDHIYDSYDVVSGSPGSVTFDFSRLDRAVDSITATGAIPVFSLSYMPQAISRDGSLISPPRQWTDWSLVVQKTIEHYSGRNGRNLKGIYYEVWNEPDLPQFGRWQLSGEKDYLTLYRYAADGAAKAKDTNPFRLGGPATSGQYQSWIMALVQSGMRLDFLSWHTYLEDPLRLRSDQADLTEWLLQYPIYMVKPRLITELGFTGDKDRRYSTVYAAAYTAAVVRQLMDAHPDYIFSFQLKNGPGQTGTGWGLVDHESAGAKRFPRYYVYPFLDRMGGTRLLLKGEGTWVTGYASTRDQTVRVLLVNFDRQGYHLENVPVTITHLAQGTYTVSKNYLFHTSCAVDQPRSGQAAPRVQVTGDTLSTTVCMPAQNVAVLEVAPAGPAK